MLKKNYPLEVFNLKEKVLAYRERIRNRINDDFACNILYTVDCNNVQLDNFVIYESSYWTAKFHNTDDVDIHNIVIDNNLRVANSDGFDIYGGCRITIENCFIATADDAIVLKPVPGVIEDVTVRNCEIMSLANNFKIGTETGCDVKNILVEDCYFFSAEIAGGNSGIAIESADGANISNVQIRNIAMNNIPSAVLVWLGYRLDADKGSKGSVGSIQGVTIENIYAKDVDIASAVVGCEYKGQSYDVKDVVLKNFEIEYRECEEDLKIYKGNDVDHTNMGGYPEITRVSHTYFISHELSAYYDMPVYGLYAYHVNGLTLENFNVKERSVNTRPFTNIGSFDERDSITNAVIK